MYQLELDLESREAEEIESYVTDLLAKRVAALPYEERTVILAKYYQDIELCELAKENNTSIELLETLEDRAIILLRTDFEALGLFSRGILYEKGK